MILRVSFEEITTLNTAAERVLAVSGGGRVMAPPEALAELAARLPLGGDISVHTLGQQNRLLRAVDTILSHMKRQMDEIIVDQYVGSDDAVNAYFDYANVLAVRSRLQGMGREMAALLEVMLDGPPSPEDIETISFPD
ncbi:MAG: hypothetical protein GWM90_33720 [Gemmatimonadetes bacterium]|nr:hypothetical protein [Gemmatimonadota bacterium]NIQ60292.1 hypothetical protein [Gemmatimonadota bacterium]NIU80510.1 hypothetical protein [Gammaproteobacteria bacterium]NIX48835.1 hypothetical protein [Gemmatimonadota bacterium]NIY13284.1 hypothetical protein [Gemmatimonadota bacterium]